MRTVRVNVQIQMDIPEGDWVGNVFSVLEAINENLTAINMESQPQIFTSELDMSDILL